MCHRLLFRRISQKKEYIQIFRMKEEIFFILHVVNGIHVIIQNVNIV